MTIKHSRPVRLPRWGTGKRVAALAGVAAISAMALPLLAPTAEAAGELQTYQGTSDPSVTITLAESFDPGEAITVSGTGWLANTNNGSAIAVLIDVSSTDDSKIVKTTRTVNHPLTGEALADKRIHATVWADQGTGNWSVTFPMPNSQNAVNVADKPIQDWTEGETHSIRLLTGSLGAAINDKPRTESITFCVGPCATGPNEPPVWDNVEATGSDPKVWVQKNAPTGAGSTLKIKGTGWTTGNGASTVGMRLNSSASTTHDRSGSGIIPIGDALASTWTVLAPGNAPTHENVRTINDDGTFETSVDLPTGLTKGDYLTVTFFSGSLADGDPVREVTTSTLLVGGSPYIPTDGNTPTCSPSASSPTVSLKSTNVSFGGSLTLTGKGWCHPAKNSGASTIAVKIDDGTYSRPKKKAVNDNLTVWAIIDPDPETGDFTATIDVPDGTTKTSTPALPRGGHSLRLLSGTLKTGDTVRTVESEEFVVGSWRPNGAPDPMEATEDLTSNSRKGMKVQISGKKLVATIKGTKKGDWIYLNSYLGVSPMTTWGTTWFRADAKGRVTAPAGDLPTGELKITAQSGNMGKVGKLLGWDDLTVAGSTTGGTTSNSGSGSGSTSSGATSATATTAPTHTPELVTLNEDNRGELTGTVTNSTLAVEPFTPQTFVHLTLIAGTQQVPVGWLLVPDEGVLTVDVSSLPDGEYRVAAHDDTDSMIGWVPLTVGNGTSQTGAVTGSHDDDVAPPLLTGFVPAAVDRKLWDLTDADATMIGMAALLLAGTAGGIAVGSRRPSRKAAA